MRVALDGVELAVRRLGDGSGTPLIWGHGLSSSMEGEDELPTIRWDEAAPGRVVVRYDARSHGESGASAAAEPHAWEALAGDQLALADALGIDRYVGAGASMGCATALFAALAAPDRITALVLVIPPTAWETRADQTALYGAMAGVMERGEVETLVGGLDAAPVPDPFAEVTDWRDRAERRLRSADLGRLAWVFRGAGLSDLPAPERLATIDVPAVILAWTGDPGHPVSTAEALHELLPDTRLHLAGTSDELARWSGIVAEFLDGR
ncbi:MAG: alpha/beta hydrolase [Actinomycetota bacterium]